MAILFTACNEPLLESEVAKNVIGLKSIDPGEYNADFDRFTLALSFSLRDHPEFKDVFIQKLQNTGTAKQILVSQLISGDNGALAADILNMYLEFPVQELVEKYPSIQITIIDQIDQIPARALRAGVSGTEEPAPADPGNLIAVVYKSYEYEPGMALVGYTNGDEPYETDNIEDNEYFLIIIEGDETENGVIESTTTEEPIEIIRKLQNPYTVENMQNAYDILQSEDMIGDGLQIVPTHLYVRFLPVDSVELETLKSDTSLELFSYPLDYELTEGEVYIDAELGDAEFTWLYTRVPLGYDFPIGGYEIIEELYLPLLSEEFSHDESVIQNWDILEEKALEITDNLDEETSYKAGVRSKSLLKAKKWTPKATIRVYDDRIGDFILVEGVKVRARWWFNWESGYTKSNGIATMSGTFKGKTNYSIVWEGRDWEIRSGNYGQAYYNGPNGSTSNWNLNIGKGGLSFMYAHIHRACFAYWNNSLGLKVPFKDSFWKQKVKIGAFNIDGRGNMNTARRWILGSLIKIYKKDRCSNLFQTTIHELAHVSHWDMNSSEFRNGDDKVFESWAVGLANQFVSRVYPASRNYDFRNWQHYTFDQYTNQFERKYTSLVIDLIDNINQRTDSVDVWDNIHVRKANLNDYPIDRVSGYTIRQIEQSLKGVTTLQQWRDNLYNQQSNTTKENLQELFDNYINL